MTKRAVTRTCFAGILALVEFGCGGGTPILRSAPTLSISTTFLQGGMVKFPYSQTVVATGGVAPFTWSLSSGNLPNNVALSSSSANAGKLSGTPDTAQIAAFGIQVRDAAGQSATKNYIITIAATRSLQLQLVPGQVPPGTVEIQGLSAGAFNPTHWQQDTLNWVPDVRMPMFGAQTTGPYQNIYAPWPLELPSGGWRLFYGGWDGQDVPFDQIYSTTTADFLSFGSRDHIIANGGFLNVNNVNVQQLPSGSLHMICTGGQAGDVFTKPVYFSSADGTIWNGVLEPYAAQLSDVITIQGYAAFGTGNFNGANVLLNDGGTWVLYFKDWNDFHTIHRAIAATLPTFQYQGVSLNTDHLVNDVKKFVINGNSWYLMGLHFNDQSLRYSLSTDGMSFQAEQSLFNNLSTQDLNIVALSYVTRGNQLLGVLYGATTVASLDQNEIFGRWLQKRIVLTDSSGLQHSSQGGYGPDRQWFQAPTSGSVPGTILVYAEDGITPLAAGSVNLSGGQSYLLVLN